MAARRARRARQVRREEKALPSYAGRRYTVLGLFVLAALAWSGAPSTSRSWKRTFCSPKVPIVTSRGSRCRRIVA